MVSKDELLFVFLLPKIDYSTKNCSFTLCIMAMLYSCIFVTQIKSQATRMQQEEKQQHQRAEII